jgi:hypothetical protein
MRRRPGASGIALATWLVAALLAATMPRHVLCVHDDGHVSIERATAAGLRCDDGATAAEERCGPGLVGEETHCHDTAIARPAIGERPDAGVPAAALVALAVPAIRIPSAADAVRAARPGSARSSPDTATRRTIVLRV